MGVEIEYKFLLRNDRWRQQVERSVYMRQGYLASDAHCSVRVRIANNQGFLNIKSSTIGIQRIEYEYLIPLTEAEEILETLCEKPFLEKTRHFLSHDQHTWEIDEFSGENAGLIVAEIELSHPDEQLIQPDWIGENVSYDIRYYSVQLARHPYKNWLCQSS